MRPDRNASGSTLRGTSGDGAKTGVLTFGRTATVTYRELVCHDGTYGHPPYRYTRVGVAAAERDWVMGVYEGPRGKGEIHPGAAAEREAVNDLAERMPLTGLLAED